MTAPTAVKAGAFRASYADSAVATWTYAVRTPPPTIAPAGGDYAAMPVISISAASSSDTIRYTLDRNEPSLTGRRKLLKPLVRILTARFALMTSVI